MEAVAADSPLMLMAAYSQWEDLYYDASALQCGFVFETGEEFLKVMETDLFQKIVDEMDQVNIHALNCAFVGGMRHVIGKKPYTTPAEMKGLKLRVPNSTTYLESSLPETVERAENSLLLGPLAGLQIITI